MERIFPERDKKEEPENVIDYQDYRKEALEPKSRERDINKH
ncbi:MAG TPA: hypothetical protein VKY40_11345 [Halanaerobiales bacterium]|nr:hypothetical protein [Halanaerobiales bacterium]